MENIILNLYVNYIYCLKCCSLLVEISEIKCKKLKQKTNQNIFNRNEEDNKIPHKIKDNIYHKKYFKEKKEDKKLKNQRKKKGIIIDINQPHIIRILI